MDSIVINERKYSTNDSLTSGYETNEEKDSFEDIIENTNLSEEVINKEIIEIENYVNLIESETSQDLVVSIVKPITDYRNNFNEFEGNILTELLSATKILNNNNLDANKQNHLSINRINGDDLDINVRKLKVHDMEDKLRLIIQMSKSLNGFRNICEEDRYSLIKYGFLEVNNMFRIKTGEMKLTHCSLYNVR